MSDKGSRKPNYTAPPRQHHDHQEVSTSAHTKDLVIIAKGKAKEENRHKEKG